MTGEGRNGVRVVLTELLSGVGAAVKRGECALARGANVTVVCVWMPCVAGET